MRAHRRVVVGAALVAVALAIVAVMGLTSLRPQWQSRSVAADLRDVAGVADVVVAADDDRSRFRVELDETAAVSTLSRAAKELGEVAEGRTVGGDKVVAEIFVAGFELDNVPRETLAESMLQAAVALGDLDGLTGVSANNTSIDMTVTTSADVLPRALDALEALDATEAGVVRTTLRIRSMDEGTTLSASVAGAEREAAVLARVIAVADETKVGLTTGGRAGSGLQLFSSNDGTVDCTAEMLVGRPEELRAVARSFAAVGEACRTRLTTSDDQAMITVATGRAGVERAISLLDGLEGNGITSVGVSSDLLSISGLVDNGDELRAWERLTRGPGWTPPEKAVLSIKWQGVNWLALEDQPVDVLQRYGPGMAKLRDAGFVASLNGPSSQGEKRLTVTDDADGAPRLVDPDGRAAMIDAIRSSGLPGEMQFVIYNQANDNSATFTATAKGQARDVELPERGVPFEGASSTGWAEEFMAGWQSAADR